MSYISIRREREKLHGEIRAEQVSTVVKRREVSDVALPKTYCK